MQKYEEREREEGTETRLPRMPETSNGDKFLGKIFWTPKLYRFLAPTERRGRRGIRGTGRSYVQVVGIEHLSAAKTGRLISKDNRD